MNSDSEQEQTLRGLLPTSNLLFFFFFLKEIMSELNLNILNMQTLKRVP